MLYTGVGLYTKQPLQLNTLLYTVVQLHTKQPLQSHVVSLYHLDNS